MSQPGIAANAAKLVASRLVVERAGRAIIAGLDFAVDAGAALVVTGPNGVGKTTLIRAIAGFLPVTEGRIELLDGDPDAGLNEQLHYIGHQNAIKSALSVRENVAFWAGYLGSAPKVDEALERFGLAALADVPTAYLSAGQKRRTALARLVAAQRTVWLLDEPTVALDAASRDALVAASDAHLASGGIIVAATHVPIPFRETRELDLSKIGMAA